MPTTRQAAAIAAKVQRTCAKCMNSDHVAAMIACDRCHRWYHRTCVEVADVVEKWTCENCILRTTVSGASISGRTNSTSRSTRIQLQLMRLEEEKKAQEKLILEQQQQERLLQEKTMAAKAELDKKYLDEKYALLIAEAEDDESGSVRSRHSRISRSSKVQEWIQTVDVAAEGNPVHDDVEAQKATEAAEGNPVPENVDMLKTEEAAGGSLVPDSVEEHPSSIMNETGLEKSDNAPNGQALVKYTGTIPKLPSIPENVAARHSPTNQENKLEADNVDTGPMSTVPGNRASLLSSTPKRSVQLIPKVTVPKPPVLTQPAKSLPVLTKLLPRPILPKPLFPDPLLSKPSSVQLPVSLPPRRVPQQTLLPQSIVEQPTLSDPDLSRVPPSKPTQQPPHVPQTIVPTSLPQQSIPAQSGVQPPPAPRTSSNSPLFLPTHMPPIPRPSVGNPLLVQPPPPSSAPQEPMSYTPPLPNPPEPERSLPRTTGDQSVPSYPSYEQQLMMLQLQNQQAMWGHFQQQLSARQVVPKELPVFSGSPEEWPLFICSYRNSTDMCGYSEAENLMRLQRCLKGRALEAVRSNLLLPSSVPQVMETLETLFGSPERLVQSLLSKVRSVPTPKAERLETLVNFGLVVQNLVGHLKAANQQAHLTNPTLLQELVDKLPPHIRLDWALFKKCAGTVDLGTFCDYMSVITSAASDVAHFSDADGAHMVRNDRQKKEKVFVNAHAPEDSRKLEQHDKKADNQVRPCYICQNVKHRIKDCFKFKSLPMGDRLKAVEQHQLCSSCLVPHGRWPCKSTRVCGIDGCAAKHHPTLHPRQQTTPKPVPAESSGARSKSDAVVSIHRQMQSTTIFRIIPVVLYGKDVQVSTFAFLDEGSSLTLIDKEMADLLELEGEMQPLCLTWTAKVTRREADSRQVNLQISGEESDRKFSLTNVRTVGRLDLPAQTLQYDELSHRYPYLSGLPVKSYEQAVPRILIGLDNLKLSVPLKKREGKFNGPVAAKTRLGWTVFGSTGNSKTDSFSPVFHICEDEDSLHDLVKGYFATENLGVSVSCGPEAEEDRRAKEILQRTTVKRADGHFETGLIWRYDEVELPPSYAMAERRLICLERKLRGHPELRASLDKQISEYLDKGYAHKATPQELEGSDPKRIWYLPLGVVTSPRKPGKVRIIWDAAAKANGLSLNDVLLKGPDLLTSLIAVLCHFRERQVAVAGDIREMFHQMKMRKADLQALRFLFRRDPSMKPEVFVMDVAIFGATCSPCSANFVKNTNAMEWKHKYPEAAAAIVENHYVDDYLDSRDTEEEMAKLASEVRKVQAEAGFELRNWRSNSVNVLRYLGEDATDQRKDFSADKASHVERVLGMAWLPDEDVFVYSVKLPHNPEHSGTPEAAPTKRSILRFVMSVFDPLGLISNLLIHGKMIIQDLWRSQVGWDEAIPTDVHGHWERWIEQFTKLYEVQIPRCYFPGYDPDSFNTLQLHVFVDASESAFACVAYFRIIDRGQPRCALIASKAKVAPLKPLSIPRLELQAAVIGSRLAKSLAEYHSFPVNRRFFWSDSKTVLSWIRSDARKYRQYVAVRIGEILEETTMEEWRWVPTKENVADEATKWGKGPTLHPDSRWFTGPAFLYQQEDEWPQQQVQSIDTEEELRVVHVHRAEVSRTCIEPERFSKWERMVRATAYVYSFLNQYVALRKQGAMQSRRELEQEDFVRAERALWRLAQAEMYSEELAVLRHSKESGGVEKFEKSSPLRKLSPFLDEFGVIRMEGRIEASPLAPYEAKFPVILPKNHRVTELLVDWYHRKFGHHNGETVVNEIRQRFHISTLRTVVRKVANRCQWCVVYKASPEVPRMAPLPAARVTPFVRPFSRVGIDYFGPYMIKIGRSQVKRWVALFTCLTIRAVYLEVTASLSTESCKLALRRFIARRGAPAEIYTDHGTNFIGASRELAGQVAEVNRELSDTFTNTNTRWFFIPPSSPHMGGAWERMVRAVKTAMESINRSRAPSEEVFLTVLCEAESMVNSRPLTYMPLETSDQEALTPNHFILLSSNGVKQTEKAPTTEGESLRNGWNLCRYLLDQFWARWIREYLPVLTMRTKWHQDVKPVQEGDAVFIVGETIRNRWIRGKVLKVIPGKDGRIRQADVQTSTGVLRRPVAKLAVLNVVPTGNPAQPE